MFAQFLMLALAAASGFARDQSEQSWVCQTNVAQMCGDDGCTTADQPVEITLYPGARLYRSCVEGDCLDGSASFFAYGESMVVRFEDAPGYARIFPDLTFVELTGTDDGVQIARGICRPDDDVDDTQTSII